MSILTNRPSIPSMAASQTRRPAQSLGSAKPGVQFGGGNVGQLAKNLGKLAKFSAQEFFYNPHGFKGDAVILSSLLLVMARIAIVNRSAAIAETPEDKRYRGFEAIKTTMREIGGWFFSFGVLRMVQKMTQKFLNKHVFGIEMKNESVSKSGAAAKEMVAQVGKWLKGKPLDIPEVLKTFSVHEGKPLQVMELQGNKRMWNWGRKLMDNLTKLPLFDSRVTVARYVPLIISSIPALILSGIVLEWFSNTKAKGIAQRMTDGIMEANNSGQGNTQRNSQGDQVSFQYGNGQGASLAPAPPIPPVPYSSFIRAR